MSNEGRGWEWKVKVLKIFCSKPKQYKIFKNKLDYWKILKIFRYVMCWVGPFLPFCIKHIKNIKDIKIGM